MGRLLMPTKVRLRWVISIICGVVAGFAVVHSLGIPAALLTGWATLAIVNVSLTLTQIWKMDAAATKAHALEEDPGQRIARTVSIIASVASLSAVLVVVVEAREASGLHAYVLAGVALVSVASSWVLIHTDYLLRYAHFYFEIDEHGETLGGIDFNQQEDPEYTDFAYFSFGLGMSYQVSDTNLSRNVIRRLVLGQTTLAYLFGAGILATVINLVSGLG